MRRMCPRVGTNISQLAPFLSTGKTIAQTPCQVLAPGLVLATFDRQRVERDPCTFVSMLKAAFPPPAMIARFGAEQGRQRADSSSKMYNGLRSDHHKRLTRPMGQS